MCKKMFKIPILDSSVVKVCIDPACILTILYEKAKFVAFGIDDVDHLWIIFAKFGIDASMFQLCHFYFFDFHVLSLRHTITKDNHVSWYLTVVNPFLYL